MALPVIEPMVVRAAKLPVGKPGWIMELKVDGARLMAYVDGPRLRLVYSPGQERDGAVP